MATRNITFSLPADLIRQAKVFAAEHDMTINALVRDLLQQTVAGEHRARAAADRLLALAERGPYSPIDPGSLRREELHERS